MKYVIFTAITLLSIIYFTKPSQKVINVKKTDIDTIDIDTSKFINKFDFSNVKDTIFFQNHDTLIEEFAHYHYSTNFWKFEHLNADSTLKHFTKLYGDPIKTQNLKDQIHYEWNIQLKDFFIPEAKLSVNILKNDKYVYLNLTKDNFKYNFLIPEELYYKPLRKHFENILKPIRVVKDNFNSTKFVVYPINYFEFSYNEFSKHPHFEGIVKNNGNVEWNKELYNDTLNSIIEKWRFPIVIKNGKNTDYKVSFSTNNSGIELTYNEKVFPPFNHINAYFKKDTLSEKEFNRFYPKTFNVKYFSKIYYIQPAKYTLVFYIKENNYYIKICEYISSPIKYVNEEEYNFGRYQKSHEYVDINGDSLKDLKLLKHCRKADCEDQTYCVLIFNPKTKLYDPIYKLESIAYLQYDKKDKSFGGCFNFGGNDYCSSIVWENGNIYKNVLSTRFPSTKKYKGSEAMLKVKNYLKKGQVYKTEYFIDNIDESIKITEEEFKALE